VVAVTYLKTHRCEGNLFNDFNYGGYLIWKLPEYQVYIDGRMQAWNNPQGVKYYDIYEQVFKDPAVRKTIFKQYNITCVLIEDGSERQAFIQQLIAQGWQTPVKANDSTLLTAPR
jgi:hypothetical protein